MEPIRTLKITNSFWINHSTYYGSGNIDVTFNYIEHSPDHWYSDVETDVDIDRDKAIEIIKFLRESFDLTETDF